MSNQLHNQKTKLVKLFRVVVHKEGPRKVRLLWILRLTRNSRQGPCLPRGPGPVRVFFKGDVALKSLFILPFRQISPTGRRDGPGEVLFFHSICLVGAIPRKFFFVLYGDGFARSSFVFYKESPEKVP